MDGNSFLTNLQHSRLLSEQAVQEVRAELSRCGSEVSLHDVTPQFVGRGLLTRWQVQMLLAGQQAFFLGRYKLLEHLGSGGMGAVFKAEQQPLGRLVAVKMLDQRLMSDPSAVARFRREIQTAAALTHPNIVTAFDAESAGENQFLVMEYVEGEDLNRLLRRCGRLSVGEACDYIAQAAQGLQHAHEHGMVHRDIKPGNLLATWREDRAIVKILDFGLAKFVSESADGRELTTTGQIVGTPDYIAPEQARESRTADIRSDIYSLGCTLFRLVAGQAPFGGENVIEKVLARTSSEAPLLRSVRPDVPIELEAIVARMLALDPEARYQVPAEAAADLAILAVPPTPPDNMDETILYRTSADEGLVQTAFDVGLRQFLARLSTDAAAATALEPATQHPVGPLGSSDATAIRPAAHATSETHPAKTQLQMTIERRKRTERKQWLGIVLAGAAFVAPLAGYAGWRKMGETELTVHWPLDEREGSRLEINGREVAWPESADVSIRGREGRVTLHARRSGFEAVEQLWNLGWGARVQFRPEWQQTDRSIRLAEWQQLMRTVHDRLERFGRSPPRFDDPQVVELRREIASFGERWAETEPEQDPEVLMRRLPWAADALRREDRNAYEFDIAGGGDRSKAPPELVAIFGDSRLQHWNEILDLDFSADGKWVASAGRDGTVKLWDTATGRQVQQFDHDESVLGTAIHRDGRYCATSSATGTIRVWDIDSGELLRTLLRLAHYPEFTRDGRLLGGLNSNEVMIWDVETWKERLVLRRDSICTFAFTGDSGAAAVCSKDGTITLWDLQTGKPRRSWNVDFEIPAVACHPNKDVLATGGWGGITIWDATTGNALHRISGAYEFDFLPNGRLAAVASMLALFDSDSGEHVWQIPSVEGSEIAVSLDGRLVATGDTWTNELLSAVRLFDAQMGVERRLTDAPEFPVRAVTVNQEGTELIAAHSRDASELRVWNLASGEPVTRRSTPQRFLHALAVGPDDRLLAGSDALGAIKVWNRANFRELVTLQAEPDHSGQSWLQFAADGTTLVAAGPDHGGLRPHGVTFWNTKTEQAIRRLPDVKGPVSLSPDGKLLATCERWIRWEKGKPHPKPALQLWNLDAEEPVPLRELLLNETEGPITSMAFSPHSRLLACGHYRQGTITLWDCVDQRKLRTLTEHDARATSVAFSPDGALVASAGMDGCIRLSDPHKKYDNLQHTLRIGPTRGIINQVCFTSDGRHLIAANQNGTIYVLRLETWSATPAATVSGQTL